MGLVCGTPARFMPAAAAAADTAATRTAQGTTITPALGAGVKNANHFTLTTFCGDEAHAL